MLSPEDYAYSTVGEILAFLDYTTSKNANPDYFYIDAIDGKLNCVRINMGNVLTENTFIDLPATAGKRLRASWE